jgi:hypothetical protein
LVNLPNIFLLESGISGMTTARLADRTVHQTVAKALGRSGGRENVSFSSKRGSDRISVRFEVRPMAAIPF